MTQSSTNKLKVGIIGQGRSGRDIHAFAIAKLPELYTIAAISDPMEERRTRSNQEFGCDTYADYRELLNRTDLDLIVNATPSQMHVPVSFEFLQGGFNVLCEKPLARWVSEVDKLIEASQKAGKTLAVFQQSRYTPAFRKIQEIIASGQIGRVVQANITYNGFLRRWDWQTLQANNGGNLLNTGPHVVDQALQLFGTDAAPNVMCVMDQANSYGDAEDYVKLILHGRGKPTIDLEISSSSAFHGPTYEVQGTRGGIKGSTNHLDWKYFKEEEAPEHQLTTDPVSKADGTPSYCWDDLKWYEESWDVPKSEEDFSFLAVQYYTMLHRSLTTGAPMEITIDEVRAQIAVMEECFRQNPEFSKGHRLP